jgi:hypothetical protein
VYFLITSLGLTVNFGGNFAEKFGNLSANFTGKAVFMLATLNCSRLFTATIRKGITKVE